mgnify:CR=1 FL=1
MGRDIGLSIEHRVGAAFRPDDRELPFAHGLTVNDRAVPLAHSIGRATLIFHMLTGYEDEDERCPAIAARTGLPSDLSPEVRAAYEQSSDPGYGPPGWLTLDDLDRYDLAAGYESPLGTREAFSAHAAAWVVALRAYLRAAGADARMIYWWF